MVRVNWPLDCKTPDWEITDWLEQLTQLTPKEISWQTVDNETLLFYRKEDAIAFKLKFDL